MNASPEPSVPTRGQNKTKWKTGLIIVGLLLSSCAKKEPASLPTASALAFDLEDIAKLEKKEDVIAFWRQHGWTDAPEKREDLIANGTKLPDEKLYPFMERYDVHIWLKTSSREGSLKVYVDEKGIVTYRMIEITNAKSNR